MTTLLKMHFVWVNHLIDIYCCKKLIMCVIHIPTIIAQTNYSINYKINVYHKLCSSYASEKKVRIYHISGLLNLRYCFRGYTN